MKDESMEFTEEQLDFIREVMNARAGDAATALEQMLELKIRVEIPLVKKYGQLESDTIYGDMGGPSRPVTAVCMDLVGQVTGKIAVIIPDRDLADLISLIGKATPGGRKTCKGLDISIVTEICNILAGLYVSSIHDFCMLNIYHTLPKVKTGLLKTLLLELFPDNGSKNFPAILVINEFITASDRITSYVLLVPDSDAIKRIEQSLRQAKDKNYVTRKTLSREKFA